ncbi:RICIN domain-containing protein [Pseudarthrobacter sp. N5]|uniref:RICIN domain-containing protein n=1 Tax=Pseudarthrobacter sp. N5 TaxID=3418416 RepID=UPI003CE6ABA7
MDDSSFVDYVADELAALPGVVSVSLGGSRASGSHRPSSDWDFALYYRDRFDPGNLRALGWEGTVSEIGAWGGGVFNGGAWLEIEGRPVDVHYRDLNVVEHELGEARHGRFHIEPLMFHLAGIPSYLVVAEIAINRVLRGDMPRPEYPQRLQETAPPILMSKDAIVTHLTELESRWTSFILNCAPNRNGKLDPNVVNRLAEVGAAWSANPQRGALPAQPLRAEHLITPVAAYASAFREPEPPYFAIDGRADNKLQTCWSTWPGTAELAMPVSITLDLGGIYNNVTTLEYLPKQWSRENGTDGDVTSFEVSTSANGVTFTTVASGTWATGPTPKLAEWAPVAAGFIRFTAKAGSGGYTNVACLRVGGRTAKPARQSFAVAPDRAYKVINPTTGKALTVLNGSTANRAAVVLAPDTNAANQRWTLTTDVDGYYKLRDANSGKILEIGFRSRAIGEKAAIYSSAEVLQPQWAMTPVSNGKVALTNRFSTYALGLTGAATTDGTTTEQQLYRGSSHQQWSLVDVT